MTKRQSPDELREIGAAMLTVHERRLFAATLNPIHAWEAFAKARARRLPVPDWVMAYLDDVAAHLLAPDGAKNAKAVGYATALVLPGRKGPSAAKRAKINHRHLAVVDMIKARRAAGRRVTDAIEDVANETKLGYDMVKAIWEGRR